MEKKKEMATMSCNESVKMICSITGKPYDGRFKNNAWPFDGWCSNEANDKYVIPARIWRITPEYIAEFGGNKKFKEYIDQKLGYTE